MNIGELYILTIIYNNACIYFQYYICKIINIINLIVFIYVTTHKTT